MLASISSQLKEATDRHRKPLIVGAVVATAAIAYRYVVRSRNGERIPSAATSDQQQQLASRNPSSISANIGGNTTNNNTRNHTNQQTEGEEGERPVTVRIEVSHVRLVDFIKREAERELFSRGGLTLSPSALQVEVVAVSHPMPSPASLVSNRSILIDHKQHLPPPSALLGAATAGNNTTPPLTGALALPPANAAAPQSPTRGTHRRARGTSILSQQSHNSQHSRNSTNNGQQQRSRSGSPQTASHNASFLEALGDSDPTAGAARQHHNNNNNPLLDDNTAAEDDDDDDDDAHSYAVFFVDGLRICLVPNPDHRVYGAVPSIVIRHIRWAYHNLNSAAAASRTARRPRIASSSVSSAALLTNAASSPQQRRLAAAGSEASLDGASSLTATPGAHPTTTSKSPESAAQLLLSPTLPPLHTTGGTPRHVGGTGGSNFGGSSTSHPYEGRSGNPLQQDGQSPQQQTTASNTAPPSPHGGAIAGASKATRNVVSRLRFTEDLLCDVALDALAPIRCANPRHGSQPNRWGGGSPTTAVDPNSFTAPETSLPLDAMTADISHPRSLTVAAADLEADDECTPLLEGSYYVAALLFLLDLCAAKSDPVITSRTVSGILADEIIRVHSLHWARTAPASQTVAHLVPSCSSMLYSEEEEQEEGGDNEQRRRLERGGRTNHSTSQQNLPTDENAHPWCTSVSLALDDAGVCVPPELLSCRNDLVRILEANRNHLAEVAINQPRKLFALLQVDPEQHAATPVGPRSPTAASAAEVVAGPLLSSVVYDDFANKVALFMFIGCSFAAVCTVRATYDELLAAMDTGAEFTYGPFRAIMSRLTGIEKVSHWSRIFRSINRSRSGSITYLELCAYLSRKMSMASDREAEIPHDGSVADQVELRLLGDEADRAVVRALARMQLLNALFVRKADMDWGRRSLWFDALVGSDSD